MPKPSSQLYPAQSLLLRQLGQRLKDARLRRRFSMEVVAVRADMSRPTLYRIERGDPSVTMGAYAQVLRVLGMDQDLEAIAKEDVLGRKLQDEALPRRRRAPRRSSGGDRA